MGLHLHPTSPPLSLPRRSARPARSVDGSALQGGPAERSAPASTELGAPDQGDAALVIRVRGGDVDAFSLLVQRHLRSAFGIAYHVLQHREDAEDAVQQAFIAALARLETFDVTRPFGPWMARVVLNHARSARRTRTRTMHGGGEMIDTIEAPPSQAPPPDRAAERSEIRDRVRAAVATLPERQRLAVQLIDIEGYTPADVGAMLEISAVTVRWHLMAGRQKLRRLLAPLVGTGSAESEDDVEPPEPEDRGDHP